MSLRWPFLEGELHLTAYGNQNEIEAASSVQRPDTAPGDPSRNAFRWDGRSLGVEWSRELPSGRLRARGWRASAHATSQWAGSEGVSTRLRSLREDLGFVLEGEGEHLGGSSSGGVRIEDSYIVTDDGSRGVDAGDEHDRTRLRGDDDLTGCHR